jgi:archaellum component FlaG (FlaF/FlaG flagellin family)
MKKLVLSLLLIFGVIFGAMAQNNKPVAQTNKPVGTQAEITFDKIEHDYGQVPRNGNGETTFTYKNTGKAPLMLSNVRSSCGCTVPSWSREPLMPGQSASIRVKYNTANAGPINKTVTVESNATNNRVILRIKGTVLN